MKIKYFKGIVLTISVVVLLLSCSAWARRVRTTDIEYDLYGVARYYESDQGFRRIVSTRDLLGNLIEEYLYDDSLPAEDALVGVRIRNIETEEWIELKRSDVPSVGYVFNIYVDGDNIGDIYWDYIYAENTISIEHLSVSGATGKGVGSSVLKWLSRYGLTQESMSQMRCSTHNPLMLDTMAKVLTDVVYMVSDISENVHSLPESKLEILSDIGEFFIDVEGDADTFGEGINKVILNENVVVSSQWPLLPVGTSIDEIEISDRWVVILNGNPIGQVKHLPYSLEIEGAIEAKRDKESLISRQLIQNGEATIEADDGVVFTLKLEKTTQDERFPGERYVVSVVTADGVEIAHSCFRIHNEWAYGYEDFRQNDDFYYFAHPDNSGMSYSEWLNISDGHNVDPALMVDKEYRLRYKGIGTTLACLELELSRMMGAEFFDAVNVLDEGFHRVIGYQVLPPNVETGDSLNMTFDLTDSSVVLSPIGITRRP